MSLEQSKKISLLEQAFGRGVLEQAGSNLQLSCPGCKEIKANKKKLYVKLESGWYHCWVCGLSGKNINFLFKKFAANRLAACKELFPDDFHPVITEEIQAPELPNDTQLITQAVSDSDTRDVLEYLKLRGLSKMDMYRWRICVSGQFPFKRKAIFPSFSPTGELNYFTARCIDETKFKYKNAKVPKGSIVFNEFDIDWDQPVILVEGVFDAIKCPDNTVPILGSEISTRSEIFKRLKQNNSTVIVAFDADASSKSQNTCKKLHRAGCTVYNLAISGNDFGSRTKQEVKKMLRDIKPWSQISLLNHKISMIKSGSVF